MWPHRLGDSGFAISVVVKVTDSVYHDDLCATGRYTASDILVGQNLFADTFCARTNTVNIKVFGNTVPCRPQVFSSSRKPVRSKTVGLRQLIFVRTFFEKVAQENSEQK